MSVVRCSIVCSLLMAAFCAANESGSAETNSQANRWAVVVGINEYQDQDIVPLKYADRDAEEFYNLLRTDSGGAFPESNIRKLINKDATTANVIQALRGFLKQAGSDDLVLLFFSCHGAADPFAKSKVVSLLTYDTKAADIASTAVPMREIQNSLDEIVRAKNVVVFIDACHAGGAIKSKSFARNSGPTTDLLLDELKKAKAGNSFLTSAGPNQESFEDDDFKHGVFTHFLLEGIKTEAADRVDDDLIRVGELFDYVRDKVQGYKGDLQIPQLNSEANRDLALAVTSEQTARSRIEISKKLYKFGIEYGERHLLQSAARHSQKAANAYGFISGRQEKLAESWMIVGKSKLALGETRSAAEAFRKAKDADGDAKCPEAALYLGIAHAKAGDLPSARAAMEHFVSRHLDSGHEKLGWARNALEWLSRPPVKRRALLVGVDRPGGGTRARDVELMKTTLVNHLHFDAADVVTLLNDEATNLELLKAVKDLREQSQPGDISFVYFSGDATADSLVIAGRPTVIGASDALELIAGIPGEKWVALDTSYIDGPANIADQDPDVNLLWAARDRDYTVAYEGDRHGFFTRYLSEILAARRGPVTNGSLLSALKARFTSTDFAYHERGRQVPSFHGELHAPFLGLANPIELFNLSQAGSLVDDLGPQLSEMYNHYIVAQPELGFQDIHLNLARYWIEQPGETSVPLALNAMRIFHQQSPDSRRLEPGVLLARAELRGGDASTAEQTLKELRGNVSPEVQKAITKALSDIEAVRTGRVQALLVGVDTYKKQGLTQLNGAKNDVVAMERLLRELGIQEISVLTDANATRASIWKQYELLKAHSVDAPALFYYSGYGSLDKDWTPTILSHDARTDGIDDIALTTLAVDAATSGKNVVAIIDAGNEPDFDGSDSQGTPSRFVYPVVDLAPEPLAQSAAPFGAALGVGRGERRLPRAFGEGGKQVQGVLTHKLLTDIRRVLDSGLRPSTWKPQDKVPFRSDGPLFTSFWHPLFDKQTRYRKLDDFVKDIRHAEIRDFIAELAELPSTEAAITQLDLCILAACIKDYPQSIEAAKQVADGTAERSTEAMYHYGRVLFESGSEENLLLAVDQLRKVVKTDKGDVRARYFLGQAILKLVQADYAPGAREHLQAYIDQGAPLGHYGAVMTTIARMQRSGRAGSGDRETADVYAPLERITRRTHRQTQSATIPVSNENVSGGGDSDRPGLKRWEVGAVLKVAFLNGDEQLRAEVKRAAEEWTQYCNVSFEFIGAPDRAVVRIRFDSTGAWSYVGTDSLLLPVSQATMALPESEMLGGFALYTYALRDFGHTLGLGYEQTQPNADLPWNEQAVYIYYQRKYSWSRSFVDRNVLQVSTSNYLGIDKRFDRDSIMMSPIPAALLLDGSEVEMRTELSQGDKRFIARLYPVLKPNGEFLTSVLTDHVVTHRHKLPIERPGSYILETDGSTQVRIQLEGAAEPGVPIGLAEPIGQSNTRIRAQLTAGSYAVTVKHADDGGTGEYRVRVSKAD